MKELDSYFSSYLSCLNYLRFQQSKLLKSGLFLFTERGPNSSKLKHSPLKITADLVTFTEEILS